MHKKSYPKIFLIFLFSLIILLPLASCSDLKIISDERLLMGTTVEIKVLGYDKDKIRKAVSEAFKEIERINNLMNYYDEESALSKLNKEAKKAPVKLDKDIYYVIDKSLEFGKITSGAFDITATSLDRKNGFKDVVLNPSERTIYFKDPKVKIDLSGSAKGYAVDRAISILKEHGIKDALVNAGGDIRSIGKRRGKDWSVGIRNPEFKNKIISVVKVNDKAAATSGNYLRPHIINTVKDNFKDYKVLSATVIADSCLKADILATSLFIMGNDGFSLIKGLKDTEAFLIIEKDKEVVFYKTSGFNEN